MASGKTQRASHNTTADSTSAVDEFMRTLDHPLKTEIEAIRRSILDVDPAIAEGIKWNAPSFRTNEYFATMNLRQKGGVAVILHLGAKVRELPSEAVIIDDSSRLLKWLGKDRAMILFDGLEGFTARRSAFERIVRQWIVHV